MTRIPNSGLWYGQNNIVIVPPRELTEIRRNLERVEDDPEDEIQNRSPWLHPERH